MERESAKNSTMVVSTEMKPSEIHSKNCFTILGVRYGILSKFVPRILREGRGRGKKK